MITLEDAEISFEQYGITTTVDADAQEIVIERGEIEWRVSMN